MKKRGNRVATAAPLSPRRKEPVSAEVLQRAQGIVDGECFYKLVMQMSVKLRIFPRAVDSSRGNCRHRERAEVGQGS